MSSGITEYMALAPGWITAGPDGNLWFTSTSGAYVGSITTAGVVTTYSTASIRYNPYDICAGPDGNLWFTAFGFSPPDAIGKITTGGTITMYSLGSGVTPHGICAGPDGNLWFTESGANKLGKITTGGSVTTYTIPTTGSGPEDICAGPDGNLWFTESSSNKIGKITPAGVVTEYALTTGSSPQCIVAGPDGNLWFTESGSNKIGRITTGGVITEFGGLTGTGPKDICAGPDANLWFTEYSGNNIGRITPTGAISELAVPTASGYPLGITAGPDKNLWFAEVQGAKIGKVAWILSSYIRATDPGTDSCQSFMLPYGPADVSPQTGNGRVGLPLDFRQSMPSSQCACADTFGEPGLRWNSDTVNVQPIIEATFSSDTQGSVPTQIQAQLTWNNGTPQPWVTFSTTGHSAGDVYLLALQVASAVTATGNYPWQVEVKATLPGSGGTIDRIITGNAYVVVNSGSDAYGYGWSIDTVNKLVADTAGVLWAYGQGGTRYFQAGPSTTYISPPNDFGTLVKNGDGSFTYTAKDQTKYNFNSAGLQTSIVDPHNLAVTFGYSSGLLSTVAHIDGGLTTFSYTSGLLATVAEPGNRVITLTHDGSGNMTGIVNADGGLRTLAYDSVHRLVNDRWGPLNATFSYDPTSGVLSSINLGLGSTLAVSPAAVQGLATSPAKLASQALGILTDALSQLTTYSLDLYGQPTKLLTPDGATQSWQRDFAGQATAYTDGISRTTTNVYQYGSGLGDLVQVTNADSSLMTYQYDSTFHEVTQIQDTLGRLTTFTYNSQGDLLTTRDALNNVTTQVWSSGLLQSVTDPLNHTTTYQYDSARRLQVTIDALTNRSTLGYDPAGNQATSQDALARVTTSVYDGLRRRLVQTDAAGAVVTMTYNPVDALTSRNDQLGHIRQYTFDQRGLEIAMTEAVGTSVQRATTLGYDALLRPLTQTDALNHTTTSGYDPVGRLRTVTNPLGGVVTYTYDMAGQRVAVTDPLGHTTTFGDNQRGWQTQVTDALGNLATTVYDT
ncbi:MAG TPA: hypothetical protein VG013_07655, partial [Gemmataceae bacterium]|nr:hypothetical protein [Gemmataceae bacterium]